MRFLLVLLAFFALATSKSIPNAEHQKYLEIFFGLPLDMKIVNDIVAEEAKALGIPAQQHFQYCLLEDDGSMVKRMNEFEEGVEQFQAEVGKMRFASVDDVMDELKRKAPKAHSSFTWIFKETIAPLGKEAAVFAVHLKEALLKMLYNHVTMSARSRPSMYGKALKKIFAEFDALSANAKTDFEKNTCFRTTMRIVDATGEQKGMVTQMKSMIKDLIAFA